MLIKQWQRQIFAWVLNTNLHKYPRFINSRRISSIFALLKREPAKLTTRELKRWTNVKTCALLNHRITVGIERSKGAINTVDLSRKEDRRSSCARDVRIAQENVERKQNGKSGEDS